MSRNVMEMSLRKPLCFYHKNVSTGVHDVPCACLTRVRSVIIQPVSKSVNCLTYILFCTFVTSKESNQAFLNAVKFMINFVSFFCNHTGKEVRLINICLNLATWSFAIERSY